MVVAPRAADPAPEPKSSRYTKLMSEIEANENTDKDQLDLHKKIHGALREDIKSELLEEANQKTFQALVQEREANAIAFVDSELDKIFDEDEAEDEDEKKRFKVARKLSRMELMEEVRTKPEHQSLRESIARGERPHTELRGLVKKHSADNLGVVKAEKKKEGKGVTGITSGAGAAQAGSSQADQVADKYEDLNQHQKEQYAGRRHVCIRAGMSEEDAHKEAMRSASKVFKNLR